jgi:hypothetical protein
MNPETKPEEALQQAIDDMLTARGIESKIYGREWTEDLQGRLSETGFRVAKDHHWPRKRDEHPANCYHCGRPENIDPFVVPGTPLELQSSAGDAGRFRHWGGDDLWICRSHPNYLDGSRVQASAGERTMDFHEAVEHLAARDGVTDLLNKSVAEIEAMKAAYTSTKASRLSDLDRQAPNGGHEGAKAREQRK